MSHARIRRLVALTAPVLVAIGIAALGAPAAPAATGTGPDFAPSVRPTQLHLVRSERGGSVTIHWRGHDRYRSLQWYDVDPVDDRYTTDQVGSTIRTGSGLPGAVRHASFTRNAALVAPDGYTQMDMDVMMYAWPLIARVRSGGTLLVTTANGRRVLRGTTRLAANECAGLGRGTRVVDLDPATLVPRRVVERRGTMVDVDYRFALLRARLTDFSPLRVIGSQEIHDDGFMRRASAEAVAALVSYPISMPTSVPSGFTLRYVGNAAVGGRLGPEAYMPRSRGVFFATWKRGLESIDLTIRPAHSTLTRDWDENDPFGGECASAATSEVTIGANTARYAQGELGPPRLWWRDGTTLYTLSGPFSVEQLATVARSLTAVAG